MCAGLDNIPTLLVFFFQDKHIYISITKRIY